MPNDVAHVWAPPVAIAVALERPETFVGTSRFVLVPSPSWPDPLAPQHFTTPVTSTAQVWEAPAAIAVTPPRSGTVVGTSRFVVVPSPSCPEVLSPQHFTFPL